MPVSAAQSCVSSLLVPSHVGSQSSGGQRCDGTVGGVLGHFFSLRALCPLEQVLSKGRFSERAKKATAHCKLQSHPHLQLSGQVTVGSGRASVRLAKVTQPSPSTLTEVPGHCLWSLPSVSCHVCPPQHADQPLSSFRVVSASLLVHLSLSRSEVSPYTFKI